MYNRLIVVKSKILFVFMLFFFSVAQIFMMQQAYAEDIIITTTEDQDNTDLANCSLREAIKLTNEDANADGSYNLSYGGCRLTTSPLNASIVLKSSTTYLLTLGQIPITKSVAIRGTDSGLVSEVNFKTNATIKVSPKVRQRIFDIDDGKGLTDSTISVTIQNVNLMGCAASAGSVCDTDGGVIKNNENLSISALKISKGVANHGGAIFNQQKLGGKVTASQIEFYDNTAVQGAAIYAPYLNFSIENSLFRKNTATDATGSVVYGMELDITDTTGNAANVESAKVLNSTFYENTGYASNLVGGMVLNNTTIVSNTGGVLITAQQKANLANSIIADNAGKDCVFNGQLAKMVVLNNLVYASGCGAIGGYQLKQISGSGDEQLFAGKANNPAYVAPVANDVGDYSDDTDRDQYMCAKPPSAGLLCPMLWDEINSIGYFKPRLLSAYHTLQDSLIVNKGYSSVLSLNNGYKVCEGKDQRNNDHSRILCDIGALELVIASATTQNGQDIFYGQKATISLKDSLGDGQLVAFAECSTYLPDVPEPAGGWQIDGCLRPADGKSYLAGKILKGPKGELTLDSEGNAVTYSPYADFHGYDDLRYYVTTTTTRFSEGVNDRSIDIRTRVVMEPYNTIESKTVNLKGGSVSLVSVLFLLGIAFLRRARQRSLFLAVAQR